MSYRTPILNHRNPNLLSEPARVALVQDALPFRGGAERVLAAVLEIFPEANVFALVHNPGAFLGTVFEGRKIHTSFIDRLPGARTRYRSYLPLFPLAIEQFDLRAYDIILSFNYAVAHGVLAGPDQLHLSYTYTPLRQAWHSYQAFLEGAGMRAGPKAWAIKAILHYLRQWDYAASVRVDHFLAVSQWTARNIWRYYRRPAGVIYPPVDVERFRPQYDRENFFIAVSRLEPHKKVSVIVEAFSRLGLPLIVIGDGAEFSRIARQAAPNVRLLGRQPDEVVQDLLGKARAFVIAAEEDFGIAPVEAQAAGCPVIAYGSGGARESVVEGQTGLFFAEQTAGSLAEAVLEFNRRPARFDARDLVRNAARFSKERFKAEFAALVEREWTRFNSRGQVDEVGTVPLRFG